MTRKVQRIKSSDIQGIKSNPVENLDELVDKLLVISTLSNESKLAKALEHQNEINSLTTRINELESTVLKKSSANYDDNTSVCCRTDAATIENFMKWVIENGAKIDGCSIHYFENYDLGIKADTDILISSLVISVPRNLMLNLEVASRSDLKDLLENDQILSNMPNVALAMFLLYLKFRKDPFWKPYLDILPKSYTTVLYFTLEELKELKGSPTLEVALNQIKSIARQYAYFYKLFHTSQDRVCKVMRKHFSYEEYRWAVSTVMTRQNTIPSEDGSQMINSLIPLWDMCNHTNGKISTDYNPKLQRSECLALRDFKQGEQFLIFYGTRTNADFFIHNGFVYEDNIHDGYWLKLSIAKADPLNEKRTALLEKLKMRPTNEYFIGNSSEPIDGQLVAFLRIFSMNEDQLTHWLEKENIGNLRLLERNDIDIALEKKSWTFLQNRLQLLLRMYPTSLDEDRKLLKEENPISTNKRLAIRMRAIEKKILSNALEYAVRVIATC